MLTGPLVLDKSVDLAVDTSPEELSTMGTIRILNPTPQQLKQRLYMRQYMRDRRAANGPKLTSSELSVLHLQKLQRSGYCPRCGFGDDQDNTSLCECELCLTEIAAGGPVRRQQPEQSA